MISGVYIPGVALGNLVGCSIVTARGRPGVSLKPGRRGAERKPEGAGEPKPAALSALARL
jgi:hypothetical protein